MLYQKLHRGLNAFIIMAVLFAVPMEAIAAPPAQPTAPTHATKVVPSTAYGRFTYHHRNFRHTLHSQSRIWSVIIPIQPGFGNGNSAHLRATCPIVVAYQNSSVTLTLNYVGTIPKGAPITENVSSDMAFIPIVSGKKEPIEYTFEDIFSNSDSSVTFTTLARTQTITLNVNSTIPSDCIVTIGDARHGKHYSYGTAALYVVAMPASVRHAM